MTTRLALVAAAAFAALCLASPARAQSDALIMDEAQEGDASQAQLFVQQTYYNQPGCTGPIARTLTRSLGQCQASLDGQSGSGEEGGGGRGGWGEGAAHLPPSPPLAAGLLYQCVQAGTTVLQLACPNDLACRGNTASGSCSTNSFSPGSCLFSSTAGQYVRIACAATGVITTIAPGGRQLRSAAEGYSADLVV
jgi:hypothetical protein